MTYNYDLTKIVQLESEEIDKKIRSQDYANLEGMLENLGTQAFIEDIQLRNRSWLQDSPIPLKISESPVVKIFDSSAKEKIYTNKDILLEAIKQYDPEKHDEQLESLLSNLSKEQKEFLFYCNKSIDPISHVSEEIAQKTNEQRQQYMNFARRIYRDKAFNEKVELPELSKLLSFNVEKLSNGNIRIDQFSYHSCEATITNYNLSSIEMDQKGHIQSEMLQVEMLKEGEKYTKYLTPVPEILKAKLNNPKDLKSDFDNSVMESIPDWSQEQYKNLKLEELPKEYFIQYRQKLTETLARKGFDHEIVDEILWKKISQDVKNGKNIKHYLSEKNYPLRSQVKILSDLQEKSNEDAKLFIDALDKTKTLENKLDVVDTVSKLQEQDKRYHSDEKTLAFLKSINGQISDAEMNKIISANRGIGYLLGSETESQKILKKFNKSGPEK
jgi:hypothetical protein